MARTRAAAGPIIETVCGGDKFKDGTKAKRVWLESPQGIEADREGRVYFSDKPKGRIYALGANGKLHAFAGTGVTDFSGDGGRADEARLHQIYGLAFDKRGDLYVVDCGNRRIRKIDGKKRIIQTVVGTGTVDPLPPDAFSGSGRPAAEVPLADPYALHVDAEGLVWFSDCAAGRVYRYDPGSGLVSLALITQPRVGPHFPAGLARVGGRLFVTDRIGMRIWVLDLASGQAEGWLGGAQDKPRIYFRKPNDLAYDGAEHLYLTDQGLHCIFRINIVTKQCEVFAGGGEAKFAKGIGRRKVRLHLPNMLKLTADGSLLFTELNPNHRSVLAIRPDGKLESLAGRFMGETDPDTLNEGQAAKDAVLFYPRGLAVDTSGNVLVSDSNCRRIRKIDRKSGKIKTVAGKGWETFVHPSDPNAEANVGGDPLKAKLYSPRGLALDGDGNLYFADANHRAVLRVGANFKKIEWYAKDPRFRGPCNVAVGPDGELYVDDSQAQVIWRIEADGSASVLAGRLGEAGYEGDGGPADKALLNGPSGVAVTGGAVYFGDRLNHRVRVVKDGKIATCAGTGRRGQGCADGPALSCELFKPMVLAADEAGNVYVTDYSRRVMKLDPASGQLTQFAGSLQYGYCGDGGPANGAQLTDVRALTIWKDEVYLADNANHALRRVKG